MANEKPRPDSDSPMTSGSFGRVNPLGAQADGFVAQADEDGQRYRIDLGDLADARRWRSRMIRAGQRAGVDLVVSLRRNGRAQEWTVWYQVRKGESGN